MFLIKYNSFKQIGDGVRTATRPVDMEWPCSNCKNPCQPLDKVVWSVKPLGVSLRVTLDSQCFLDFTEETYRSWLTVFASSINHQPSILIIIGSTRRSTHRPTHLPTCCRGIDTLIRGTLVYLSRSHLKDLWPNSYALSAGCLPAVTSTTFK